MHSGFELDQEIITQMEQMGAPADVLAAARAQLAPADFELFDENIPSFALFQRMRTQWRTRGMDGDLIGLDYGPLNTVMRLMKIRPADRSQCFDDLHLMEIETLSVTADRKRASQQ